MSNYIEVLYWALIILGFAIVWLRHDRPPALSRDTLEFQRGLTDGVQFAEAGGQPRQLQRLVDEQRALGRGAYASGLAQSLWVQP